jgi:hypothetical protein
MNINYGRLQDLISLFKTPMETRKIFFEMYRKFGHAPSKWFASPTPHLTVARPGTSSSFTDKPRANESFCTQCGVKSLTLDDGHVAATVTWPALPYSGRCVVRKQAVSCLTLWAVLYRKDLQSCFATTDHRYTAVKGWAWRGRGKVQDNRLNWDLRMPPYCDLWSSLDGGLLGLVTP